MKRSSSFGVEGEMPSSLSRDRPTVTVLPKPLFLEPNHLPDKIALRFEFRKRSVHLIDDNVADLIKERVVEPKVLAAVIDRAAHYLAQDVIAAFVAGQDAVCDCKRRRTGVVGDHAGSKLLGLGQFLVTAHQLDNITKAHARGRVLTLSLRPLQLCGQKHLISRKDAKTAKEDQEKRTYLNGFGMLTSSFTGTTRLKVKPKSFESAENKHGASDPPICRGIGHLTPRGTDGTAQADPPAERRRRARRARLS